MEMRAGTVETKSYSDVPKSFARLPSRPKPREIIQEPALSNTSFQPNANQTFPGSLSNGYALDMGSHVPNETRRPNSSMDYPQVPNPRPFAAPAWPMSRGTDQERQSQSTQALNNPSEEHQQLLAGHMRGSALPQFNGLQPTGTMYPQRGRTQHQVQVSDPVVDATYPAVLGWAQQQDPGVDSAQKRAQMSSHPSSSQQQQFTTSKGGYLSFSNVRLPNTIQMQTVPQPVAHHRAAAQSVLPTTEYRSIPAATSPMVSRIPSSQISTPISSRPAINGYLETSDRLRARQNMPVTPPRQMQMQGPQRSYQPVQHSLQSTTVLYSQPSHTWTGRQKAQQPTADHRRLKSCEMCRRSGQAPGSICYH
ncbi:hypothetical protein ONS95_005173 [Cadophora gregata]|nr:uncharacterized protein ONS95_005173 [Cadophora gregata]KAK0104909.1 hypothetical protein ONS95_005173 [Cadophora gregata]KAK0115008.1 hypothetical protein ONS96_013481 [Cadophora gregata f. sp. sojae]